MKLKYLYISILFFFVIIISVCGQAPAPTHPKHFDINKFKKEKADFIIKELNLSDIETKTFIPLINELMDKRFEVNRMYRHDVKILRSKKDKTNSDYSKIIEEGFKSREKQLELEKEYYQKFLNVISPQKIYEYQKAENKFMRQSINNKDGKIRK